MARRPLHSFLPLCLLPTFLLIGGAPGAKAESRPVDTKRFPRLTHIFLLPEERALLKELKDDKDRREFQKIFWARRDPTPGTPANEFEDNVRAVWKRADDIFSYPNQKGSETGCGQVLALLGRPEEALDKGDAGRTPKVDFRAKEGPERSPTPGPGRQFDNSAYIRDGAEREPETWVYRDRPGLPYSFTGAELRIAFDSECRFAEGGILAEDLRRAAAAFVTQPDITYSRGSDGHLVPLAASAASSGASAGARELLAAPRSDFPLAAEPKLLMRGPKGEAYVAGLIHTSAGAASAPARLSLAAQASDAAGQEVASAARDVTVRPEADGSLVASWGLSLKPGHYKVTVAALLPQPNKGSWRARSSSTPMSRRRAEPLTRATPTQRCSSGRRACTRASATYSPPRTPSWWSPRSTARRWTPPRGRPVSAPASASSRTAGRWRAAPRTCSPPRTPWPRSAPSRSPTTRRGPTWFAST
jgi:GWxTD domain-containing protein